MDRTVHAMKAARDLSDVEVPTLTLIFDQEPPEPSLGDKHWERTWRQTYEQEGDRIEAFLFESLPGGLYDQLLRAMLTRKASLFKVTHKG